MRILVTGAAGFMASHLAEALAKEGHEVYGIDNLSIGVHANVPSTIKFAVMDMRNADDMASVIEECRPELIYHAAAWAHEGLSQFMPKLITDNNYTTFLNMITPAIRCGMKRIVIFSSMSVYGSQTPPFSETMLRAPEDVYAVAKTAMEYTTEILADVHNFQYTIIRPHNVYGERQALHDPYRNVIGITMNRIMKDLPPIIYGDGEQTRAFTYISDVTPYILAAGFQENTVGQIINIGPTEEYSINHLAEVILKEFGKENLTSVHMPDRPREVKHAFSTNSRAIELLGYHTSVTLEEGIHNMANWARTIGPVDFQYLDELELEGTKIPETWKQKLL